MTRSSPDPPQAMSRVHHLYLQIDGEATKLEGDPASGRTRSSAGAGRTLRGKSPERMEQVRELERGELVAHDLLCTPTNARRGQSLASAEQLEPVPGAVRVWHFDQPFPSSEPGAPPQGLLVYHTPGLVGGHRPFLPRQCRSDLPADQQYVCGGTAGDRRPKASATGDWQHREGQQGEQQHPGRLRPQRERSEAHG